MLNMSNSSYILPRRPRTSYPVIFISLGTLVGIAFLCYLYSRNELVRSELGPTARADSFIHVVHDAGDTIPTSGGEIQKPPSLASSPVGIGYNERQATIQNDVYALGDLNVSAALDHYSSLTWDDLNLTEDGYPELEPKVIHLLSNHFHDSDPRAALPPVITAVDAAGEDPLAPYQVGLQIGPESSEENSLQNGERWFDNELTYSDPCGPNCWILRTSRDVLRMLLHLAVNARLVSRSEALKTLANTVGLKESNDTDSSATADERQNIGEKSLQLPPGWIDNYHNLGMPVPASVSSKVHPKYRPPSPPIPFPRGSMLDLLKLLQITNTLRFPTTGIDFDSELIRKLQYEVQSKPTGELALDMLINKLGKRVYGIELIHWPLVFDRNTQTHHLLGENDMRIEIPPLLIPNHYRVQSNPDRLKSLPPGVKISPTPKMPFPERNPVMDVRAENRLPELQFLRDPFIMKLQPKQGVVVTGEGYLVINTNTGQATKATLLVPGAPCEYGSAQQVLKSMSQIKIQTPLEAVEDLINLHAKRRSKLPAHDDSMALETNIGPKELELLRRRQHRRSVGFILTQYYGYGPFHWLVECLPRVVYLRPILRLMAKAGAFQDELADHSNSPGLARKFEAYIHVPLDLGDRRTGVRREKVRMGIGGGNIPSFVLASLRFALRQMNIALPLHRIIGGDIKYDVVYVPPATSCGRISPIAGPILREVLQAGVKHQPKPATAVASENVSVPFRSGLIFIQRRGARELTRWNTITHAFRQLLPRLQSLPNAPLPVTWTMAHEPPSFDVVMERFFNARAVFGPHGAGLANTLVSPKGSIVFEITASDWKPGNCYQLMAWYLKHRWWGLAPRVNPRDGPITLSNEELERALRGFTKMVSDQYLTFISGEQP